jgi:hypothetical protein
MTLLSPHPTLVIVSLSLFVVRRAQSNVGEVELDVSRTQLKLESLDYSLTVRARAGSTGCRIAPSPSFSFSVGLGLGMEDCGRNGR